MPIFLNAVYLISLGSTPGLCTGHANALPVTRTLPGDDSLDDHFFENVLASASILLKICHFRVTQVLYSKRAHPFPLSLKRVTIKVLLFPACDLAWCLWCLPQVMTLPLYLGHVLCGCYRTLLSFYLYCKFFLVFSYNGWSPLGSRNKFLKTVSFIFEIIITSIFFFSSFTPNPFIYFPY